MLTLTGAPVANHYAIPDRAGPPRPPLPCSPTTRLVPQNGVTVSGHLTTRHEGLSPHED